VEESRVGRRRFDHMVVEISVALGQNIPRFALWMRLHDHGSDPEELTRDAAVAFCGAPLSRFLADHGLALPPRTRRKIQRAVHRYDPAIPTPYERMARL
jgi:hypothetical protein